MGYYNQALTDYVGKICDVERELYTTQRLIANLDYQMQRLGHPREVDPLNSDGGQVKKALLSVVVGYATICVTIVKWLFLLAIRLTDGF